MKKIAIVFLVFFLGTSGLISIDSVCKETTGEGGKLSLSVKKEGENTVSIAFLGRETEVEF